eukprot:Sspe_Gene.68434::Locus_40370_Transcript_2_2_Confidence_0.600_Length_3153::g.68434::m.68434/K05016/CLCN7; chloride channel 7
MGDRSADSQQMTEPQQTQSEATARNGREGGIPNDSFSSKPPLDPRRQRQASTITNQSDLLDPRKKMAYRRVDEARFDSINVLPSEFDERHDQDLFALLNRIEQMDPSQRQALKHHLALFEATDAKALAPPVAQTTSPEQPMVDWRGKLLKELESTSEKAKKKLVDFAKYESLNYAGNDDNVIIRQEAEGTGSAESVSLRVARWCLFIFVGLMAGLTAFAVKSGEEFIGHWKIEMMEQLVADERMTRAYLSYTGISCLFSFIGIFVTLFAPAAAGSGVPDVKAYLNGVNIPGMLKVGTYFVKVIGVIFGVASGLAMGPEGPMIHAGAVLAGGISQGRLSWPFNIALKWFRPMRNDANKRDFVSAGAAAGVAAAFGAPIGGVLFSLEEASSFWSSSQTWRTLLTCIFATFTMTILVYGGDRFNDPGLVHFGVAENTPSRYRLWEIVAWMPLAVAMGVLGALFNALAVRKIAMVNRLRKKIVAASSLNKKVTFGIVVLVEGLLVTVIISSVSFYFSTFGECNKTPFIDLPLEFRPQEMRVCSTQGHGVHFMPFECSKVVVDLDGDEGSNRDFNEFATVALLPQLEVIRVLLSRDETPSGSPILIGFKALGLYAPIYFVYILLTVGLFLPQGLFVPHIVMGALCGRLTGTFVYQYISHEAKPGTYALMGAAGMLAGSSRITISLSVIIFEITNDIQYLVPIIMVVLISKNIGDLFNEPYYECLIELRHIPFIEETPPKEMHLFHVGDIMTPVPRCIPRHARVTQLRAMLKETPHNSYPVIRSEEDRTLMGVMSRDSLLVLMNMLRDTRSSDYPEGCVAYRKGCPPATQLAYDLFCECEDKVRLANKAWIDELLDIPAAQEIEEDSLELTIDLLPYINLSAYIVPSTFSLLRAFHLFRSQGLRHIIVVNTAHAPIGMITRTELTHYYLYVWKMRTEERELSALTPDHLKKIPSFHNRLFSVHQAVEEELERHFGSFHNKTEEARAAIEELDVDSINISETTGESEPR